MLRFVGVVFRVAIALPLVGAVLLGLVVFAAEELFHSARSLTDRRFLNES